MVLESKFFAKRNKLRRMRGNLPTERKKESGGKVWSELFRWVFAPLFQGLGLGVGFLTAAFVVSKTGLIK